MASSFDFETTNVKSIWTVLHDFSLAKQLTGVTFCLDLVLNANNVNNTNNKLFKH